MHTYRGCCKLSNDWRAFTGLNLNKCLYIFLILCWNCDNIYNLLSLLSLKVSGGNCNNPDNNISVTISKLVCGNVMNSKILNENQRNKQ